MLEVVIHCEMGASKKAKEQRSIRSMRIHFIWFLTEHNLYSSIFVVNTLNLETMNYIMACYAAHLGTGHTLSSRCIRSGSISKYLHAAASLVMVFDDAGILRDPRKAKGSNTLCFPLSQVMKELKRYEDVPNRREPFTVGMLLSSLDDTKGLADTALALALYDWYVLAVHAGLRRGEWAQDRNNHDIKKPELNIRSEPQAFQLGDIRFKGPNRRFLTHDRALGAPNQVQAVELRWRTQKNLENGEKKIFARNTKDPRLCPVTHALRIVSRFAKLRSLDDTTTPLAIYQHNSHKDARFITSADIETSMRTTAMNFYDLDPVKDVEDIMRFSAHSLRVGACVILQSMGFETHQIQHMLRWKSDSWRMYCRNLLTMSKKQNEAVIEASMVPVV